MASLPSIAPALALAGLFLNPVISQAQTAGTLDAAYDPSVTDGRVTSCLVQPDSKALIGGLFTDIHSVSRVRIARLAGNGAVEAKPNFNVSGGELLCMAMQPDGAVVLGGNFTAAGIRPASGLARMGANGEPETGSTFNPGNIAGGEVRAVAIQPDGKILIGGTFTSVSGQPRNRIARLHPNGTLESTATFNPGGGVNGSTTTGIMVNCLIVQPDGKILVAGGFADINGQPRNNIARLHSDGSVESTNSFSIGPDSTISPGTHDPAAGGRIESMALRPDGKILISGWFTTVNDEPRASFARLLPNGTLEGLDSFNTGNGPLMADTIALQADGKILVGGNFLYINGQPRNRIARLQADGTLEDTATFNAGNGANPGVGSIVLQGDGKILAGGAFTTFNGQPRKRMARLHNDPVLQSLTVLHSRHIQWARGGALPEIISATFELSTDGVSWTPLGAGAPPPLATDPPAEPPLDNDAPVAGMWQLSGLNLPASGRIRARGRTCGGGRGNSSGLVEWVSAFPPAGPEIAVEQPVGTNILSGGTKNFGPVIAGTQSNAVFTVKNTGSADLTLLKFTIGGPDAALFNGGPDAALFTEDAIPPAPVPGGGSTTFTVQFSPPTATDEPKTATLTIASNDPDESPFTINLTGIGVNAFPDILVEQPPGAAIANGAIRALGTVGVGRTATLPFTVKNEGQGSLTGVKVTTDGADAALFTITTNPADIVTPGGSTTFEVTFAPVTHGTMVANLHIAGNDPDENPFTIKLTGTAVADAAPDIRVVQAPEFEVANGATLTLGTVGVGRTATFPFTVKNEGLSPLTGLTVTKGGNDANLFTIATNPAAIVAPGGNTTFEVTFTPDTNSIRAATLHIASNDPDESPFDINLTAEGVHLPPLIELEDTSTGTSFVNGATRFIGSAAAGGSAEKTFLVKNGGAGTLFIFGTSIEGPDKAMFVVKKPPPAETVPPGGSTTFTVRFAPTTGGSKTATLHIFSSDVFASPFSIILTGTAGYPPSALDPWRLHYFGSSENSGPGADLADPDNDGILNLLEFGTGSNPLVPTPSPGTLVKNGPVLEFTYSRPNAALAELTYTVEESSTLSGPWTSTGMTSTILSDDGTTQVIKVATAPATAPARFVRLRVTRNY